MLEAQIKKVVNGYIVSEDVPYNDDTHLTHHEETVFEETDRCACDRKALVAALYHIVGILGDSGTKHDMHRIRVLCDCQAEVTSEG